MKRELKTRVRFHPVPRCSHALPGGRLCALAAGHAGEHTPTPAAGTVVTSAQFVLTQAATLAALLVLLVGCGAPSGQLDGDLEAARSDAAEDASSSSGWNAPPAPAVGAQRRDDGAAGRAVLAHDDEVADAGELLEDASATPADAGDGGAPVLEVDAGGGAGTGGGGGGASDDAGIPTGSGGSPSDPGTGGAPAGTGGAGGSGGMGGGTGGTGAGTGGTVAAAELVHCKITSGQLAGQTLGCDAASKQAFPGASVRWPDPPVVGLPTYSCASSAATPCEVGGGCVVYYGGASMQGVCK